MLTPGRKAIVTAEVVEKYEKGMLSCEMIAQTLGVTRQAVYKYLKAHGVETAKHKYEVPCFQCGKMVVRTRARVRDQRRSFCSTTCYFEFMKGSGFNQHRHGCRIARMRITEAGYDMPDGYLPHHVDGNQDHNDLSNLWMFKNNSDHMRYHRGGRSEAFIFSKRRWEWVQMDK